MCFQRKKHTSIIITYIPLVEVGPRPGSNRRRHRPPPPICADLLHRCYYLVDLHPCYNLADFCNKWCWRDERNLFNFIAFFHFIAIRPILNIRIWILKKVLWIRLYTGCPWGLVQHVSLTCLPCRCRIAVRFWNRSGQDGRDGEVSGRWIL